MATTARIVGLKCGEDIEITVLIDGEGSIADWEFESNLRDDEAGILALTKQSGDGIVISDAEQREIVVTLPAAETAVLRPVTYMFDVWRTNVASQVCLCDGTLQFGRTARHG